MPTIPTSRSTSTGRSSRSRRSPPSSPAPRSTRSTCAPCLKACVNCEGSGDDCFDPEKNPSLRREIKAARKMFVPDNYIQRVIQFAKQGYTDIQFPIYDTDWDSEAYLTVSGPELEQLRARHRRIPQGGGIRRRLGPHLAAQSRTRSRRHSRRATCGKRSLTPPGLRPIRACSTTPPSTTGTPARRRGRSAARTRARNTCSSTTRRAISRRSTCSPSVILRRDSSMSRVTNTPCGCGQWCSKSR